MEMRMPKRRYLDEKKGAAHGKGKPFAFRTAHYLRLLTGLKASRLSELADCLEKVDDMSIFYHIYHPIFSGHLVPEEYPNDFAYWTSDALRNYDLAERIADIDLPEPQNLDVLRKRLIGILCSDVEQNGDQPVRRGYEFHFITCTVVSFPTEWKADTLFSFLDSVSSINPASIVYHKVTERFVNRYGVNGFSAWIRENFGYDELANSISAIDPQTMISEEILRMELVNRIVSFLT
ncbi:MAG: hypothetical protein KIS30_09215 [Thermoplasmata archaeon]|nr:hypothetical protein [Candidatus Sysuiplasma acidicola]MBX8646917.1 hypothetical protein [Candidatus Sysuiplasma acidicola]MDH2905679.1 DUF5752 family protein [Methanomassiliicoccales archaeon]